MAIMKVGPTEVTIDFLCLKENELTADLKTRDQHQRVVNHDPRHGHHTEH